jgi:hypothetical protein
MPEQTKSTRPLVRYEAARQALAEARRGDEVKDIRDQAMAMQLYAQQAKDRSLIEHATKIRMRAEIGAGELLMAIGERRGGNQTSREGSLPSNAQMGITNKRSHRWQPMAALPEAEQEALIERAKKTAIAAVDSDTRGEKAERRAKREIELAERQVALPDKRYGVIYVDHRRDTGVDRTADNHYRTMTLDDIKALEVPAADDCVLFLWATTPMLAAAFSVMATWGFSYRSCCVWAKDRVGTGYWFSRDQAEHLLVGTRGKIPAPAPGEQNASLINAPVGKHSAKGSQRRRINP